MDASAFAKRVSDLGATHRDLWRADADETYAKAKKELDLSLSRLTSAQRTRLAGDFSESKAASDRAIAILRPLETSLNKAIETMTTVQGQAREVEQLIAGADATNEAIESFKASLTDAMQASRKSGREQITQARDRLAVGQKNQNPTAVSEAMKFAQSASTTLNQVLEQVKKAARGVFEQQLGEAIRAADEAFARISAAITTLDRRAATNPDLVRPETTDTRARLEKQIDGLRRRFERARKAEDLSSLNETTRQAGEAQLGLDTLIRSFGPLSLRDRGINASLEEGARLFLQGEYQQALSALEPLIGQANVPLQLHAHVFRAASLFALFVRSGESNQALRSQALAEIAHSKQLNPSFQPNPRAFSPRFLSLYQNGDAPVPQPGGATAQ
jgi:tetratricopeptide (TPR) repeat protein